MSGWVIGSERKRYTESRSIPPVEDDEPVPAGRCHAVPPGAVTSACGAPVAWVWDDLPWGRGIGMDWCRDCQQIVDGQ